MRIRIQDTSVYCVCVYVGPIGSFYFCASGVFEAMLEALRRLSPEKCSDVPSLKLGCNGCNGCKKTSRDVGRFQPDDISQHEVVNITQQTRTIT